MTQEEEIRRGHEAERVLNEPLLKDAFARVEAAIVEAIKRSPAGAKDTQHELALSLQLLAKVQNCIHEVVQTGKLASIQKESVAQRVAAGVRRLTRAA